MTTQTRDKVMRSRAVAPPGPRPPADQGLPGGGGQPDRRERFTKHTPAGETVLAYLSTQAGRLKVLDPEVRRERPDAVHQMRVAVRRLRAALQAFTEIVSGPETEHLRAELKWLGGVLGEARDTEVLVSYLHGNLAAVPTELVLGPAQARVTAHFAPFEGSRRKAVLDALDSERYQELRAELGRLLDNPPLAPRAAEPAGAVLPLAVGRAYRRTRRRMRRARQAPAGQQRDVALHETRKAAKRARYAAEAATPALGRKAGKKARRFAKSMKEVQSVLGAHQDAVIARAAARDIGVHAHLAGENAFSFGLLQDRAHHQALACEEQTPRVWRRARRKARWLPA
ncbi:MAG TPA: CHAD domain-containing protein [Trebonia sp.]|nr:CHAD domain-containing protein [Trebonia sp.]